MILEWFRRGQTIGESLLGLRVIDESGLRLRFSQVAMRNLMRLVDMLPVFYLLGRAACFFSRKAQRLGDMVAGTVVVGRPPATVPDLERVLSGKYNSLRQYAHLTARLRQSTTPEEAQVALQSLLRRDQLEPDARVTLFRELAEHFRARLPFPPEAGEGVSDEQYIHNVVDILFKSESRSYR